MKSGVFLFFLTLISFNVALGQSVKHVYRFYENFNIAEPECGPDLSQAKALGNCGTQAAGGYEDDLLPCGVKRKVYHTNKNWGLSYPNTSGTITNNYTIQMYVKVSDWGETWARIIDFSNGQLDDGIYFKNKGNSADRCIDFYPSGIAGPCPFFNTSTYYLLTFTRNGITGIMDVYVGNTLFVSYNDSNGRYVGKTGTPIYIFRDDSEVPCESGAANFAYLSFSNQYSSQNDVTQVSGEICFKASINASADFSIDPNPTCSYPKDITIKYTGEIPAPGTGYTFNWDWDGGRVVSGSGMGPYIVNWNTPGAKNVTLTVTNNSCGNKIVNIKQTSISSLDLKTSVDKALCSGQTSTITLTPVEGTAPFQYSIDSVNYQNEAAFKVNPNFYHVYVKDANNCIVSKAVQIDSLANIFVKTNKDTTICTGQQVLLSASSNASIFSWSPVAGLDDASSQNPVATPVATTQYIVTVSTENNCTSRDTMLITVKPDIEVVVTPDTVVEEEVPFQLNASSPDVGSKSNVTYEWSPPRGLSSTSVADPTATLLGSETYTIKISDDNGCFGTAQVTLTVPPLPAIYIPNTFTPNGDGNNETLNLIANRITKLYYFKIYNRWGEVVFSTDQVDKGWDGKYKGGDPIAGTYVFKLEGLTEKGTRIKKEGAILLIR